MKHRTKLGWGLTLAWLAIFGGLILGLRSDDVSQMTLNEWGD